MAKIFAILVGLSTSVACCALSAPKTEDGLRFGAPFPGSAITSVDPAAGCGERYKFSTSAGISAAARFYLDEGRDAHLTLLKDTDAGDPNYRMIAFDRPKGHQVLFVILSKTGTATTGSVYYSPANSQPCN